MENALAIYGSFIKDIKDLIYRRQYEAMKKVNTELIQLYWEIGEEIDRKQREQGWGKSVVEILAKELQKEFPGVQGFTTRNLWFMRQFYMEYFESAKLKPLVSEISWSKNIVIMQKCKDPLQREFYIKMTKRFGWTKDVLINNIENRAYEKYLTSQTNFDDTVAEKYRLQAKLAVKDDYLFQRRLRCLVARVEYTLKSSNKPIGVASYSFYENLPEEMRSLLPSPDEIATIIRGIGGFDDD